MYDLSLAAELLRKGKLVVFPTETVYGLGGRADIDSVVSAIFVAKGRPPDNPLIVHVDSIEMARRYAILSRYETALFERFSPGPLTLILPRRAGAVSERVTAGGNSVAIRIPDSQIALELIRGVNCGLAAPSANRSGRPSPTAAVHAVNEMGDTVSGVVDGGPCRVGIESTVAQVRGDGARILRPGVVTETELNAVLQSVRDSGFVSYSDRCGREKYGEGVPDRGGITVGVPRAAGALSPGTRFRHYAPSIPVRPVVLSPDSIAAFEKELVVDGGNMHTPGSEVSIETRAEDPRRQRNRRKLVLLVLVSKPRDGEFESSKWTRSMYRLSDIVTRSGGHVIELETFRELEQQFYALLVEWERKVDEIWVQTPAEGDSFRGLRDRILRSCGIAG